MGYTTNSPEPDVTLIEEHADEIMEVNVDYEEIEQNFYSDSYVWFSFMSY